MQFAMTHCYTAATYFDQVR